MTNPAAPASFGLPTNALDVCLLSARCHAWLEEARSTTTSPSIQRLIDDLHDDLYQLGPIDDDLVGVVQDALESVASAIEVESGLLATLTLASLN